MIRDFTVTYVDGTEQTFTGITRSVLESASDRCPSSALSLYRRAKPSDAEEHVVSLPLVQVRKWVKS